ncbi:pirin family protein [Erythrobacter sp. NE805]|uniref:pirin family protein n=1 Tax=Erythrobacter sp. NE805 TaxID=3389875 RepID=UPI00396B461A
MLERVITKRTHDLGGGFTVGRVLPFHVRRMVGPYIFFDHIGPVELAPGIPRELDVRPHPHIGLATVTYLFDGAITHRDSLAVHQEIHPGEVNWMIAGKGITHSERFEHARLHGALMHGIQAWVALPEAHEEADPAFSHHADLPAWDEPGLSGRLIAGEMEGMRAGTPVHSPQFYAHWQLEPGARRVLPAEYPERAAYVAAGVVAIGGERLEAGAMAVLAPGAEVPLVAETRATVMVLGGEPVGERFMFWNFVHSRKDRIRQAAEDWREGRWTLPPNDNAEFTPLPEFKGF